MDDVQVGSVIRAVRLRRGLTQSEVAAAAGVSASTVSLIERGGFETATVRAVRRVAAAVGVSLPFAPGWRSADLAKLLDERHAYVCRAVAARLARAGWLVMPEFTFSYRGERGSVDLLAWHSASRSLLLAEAKTALPDLQDALSTMDRKRRLARTIVAPLGWRPGAVASVLVVAHETWARNATRKFGPLSNAALPARTVEIRRWLRRPSGDVRGVWFLLDSDRVGVGRRKRGPFRVRRRAVPRRETGDEANLASTRPKRPVRPRSTRATPTRS